VLPKKISESAVRRLSFYHRILEDLEEGGTGTVSSRELAERSGTTAPQIRKDLSLFGSFGKRGLGYPVRDLIRHLRAILGLDRAWRVALVGAGRIGAALFEYRGFRERGFNFVSVLDSDHTKVGRRWGEVTIEHTDDFSRIVKRERIDMVVLAVPAGAVLGLMEAVHDAGVNAVLNFAPTRLDVPEGMTVRDVNMVMELESLSFALSQNRSRLPDPAHPREPGDAL
jgi:redox-sensing transcriptional repressor